MFEDSQRPASRKRTALGGFSLVLVATAVAGASGYAIQWLAAALQPAADYRTFAVFWSALFFVVGALSGVQQEVTRAASPLTDKSEPRTRLLPFAALFAAATLVALGALSPLWAPSLFGVLAVPLALALALGASCYVLVAIFCGSLYGARWWVPIATMIAIDGVLRLALVALVLLTGGDTIALAWAIVLPFPAALVIVVPVLRRRLRGAVSVDILPAKLGWNSLRTIGGSTGTGLMVSGFPFLLGLTTSTAEAAQVGALILPVTLTRAPLIVPLMALQSFMVVFFSDRRTTLWRALGAVIAVLAGIVAVLAALAWLVGPTVLELLFSEQYSTDGTRLALYITSAGLLAALSLTSPAVLAASGHSVFLAGWFVAAATTIVTLVLPLPLEFRVFLSLFAGPLSGLLVHLIGLLFLTRRPAAMTDQG